MSSWTQIVYDRSPTVMRSVIASTYGLYLRRMALHGRDTERLVQEALSREYWHRERWQEWQAERLDRILRIAAFHTRHYAPQSSSYSTDPTDGSGGARLGNWPILEKETLRSRPRDLMVAPAERTRLFAEHTSGTTGTPLTVWHSQSTLRSWYALFEARCRRWYGVSGRDRWAILGGRLIKPVHESSAPFWIWNHALHQLYLSTYHLSPDRLQSYVDALVKYRVRYALGYTSALYELACQILRQGRDDVRLAIVVTNAEPVEDYQREVIERAFGCPVRETYGMSEYGAGASECEAGGLHLWPEAGLAEVCDDNDQIRSHGSGQLLLTSLLKEEMPLIRYRVGDRATLLPPESSCPCGRTLPLLGRIDGRSDDVLVTPRGDRVGRLDPVFKSELPIREAQIIQEAIDRIVVKYVPDDGFRSEHLERLKDALRSRLGSIRIECQAVDRVQSASGKFRAVVSLLHQKSD